MGIDPDAYMAGAIPSLNRGGSWRMDEPDPHGSQYHSVHPDSVPGRGGSIFPRPSQIVPPPPAVSNAHANGNGDGNGNGNGGMNLGLNVGNRGNFHPFLSPMTMGGHPFMSGMPSPPVRGVQSQSGSRKAGSVRPTLVLGGVGMGSQREDGSGKSTISHVPSIRSVNHPGWASLPPTGQGHNHNPNHNANASTRTRSSPSSPTTPSSANFIAGQATSQYGLKAPGKVKVKPLVLSPGAMAAMEPSWVWESATHNNLIPTPRTKGMTTEPDYFSIQHRGSPTMAYDPHTPRTPRTPFEPGFESLPPPPRPAPGSPRVRVDSHRSQIHPAHHRPPPTRRHTHDRFSPDREPPLERERERERKPSGTRAMTRVDSKSLGRARVRSGSGLRRSTMDSEAGGESYYAPSKTYAHTLDDRSRRAPSSIATSTNTSFAPSTTPTNLTASLEKSRPGHTRRSTSVLPSSPLASSQASFTERRLKNRPQPALSTINSTIDFTQTAPSSPTISSRHQRQPSLDMRSLNDALPQTAPLQAPSSHGYIPPTSEDEYDPYAAHPAPAPHPTPSTSPSQTNPKPTGAGLKHVTPDSYRPPGFPKATKQLAWNRDGPAMKTHGVAWLREAEVDKLPGGPAGPRYIQARPPMSAIQSGGSWWDSAA